MLLHIQSMVPGPTCCRNHSGTTCTIYRQPQPLLRERSSPRRSCSPLQTTTMHVRHNSPLPSPDKTILWTKYSKENSHARITVPEPYPLPQACPRSYWFDPCSEEFRWERSSPQSSQYRCGMISSPSAGRWRTQCLSSRLPQRNNRSLFPCRRWHSKYQLMIVAWG